MWHVKSAGHLHEAARRGDLPAIRAALTAGVDLDARDAMGWTALMWAAHAVQRGAIDLLLEAGADPAIRDRLVQDAADIVLHTQHALDGGVDLSLRIQRHPVYVRRSEELSQEARRFADALRGRIRGRIVTGGGLSCHGDWRIETRYRGMACLVWVFASGTTLWVQNYRGGDAALSYQIEDEDRVGVVRSDELRSLSTKLEPFWSERFPVYCRIYSDKVHETSAFVGANESDLRALCLERYEWLVVTAKQIRMRSLLTDVEATVDRLDHIATIFARTSRPLPKPIINKPARLRPRAATSAAPAPPYAHALWGQPACAVECPGCQQPIHRIAVLDTADPILAPLGWPWPRLEILMCLRCSMFAGPSWVRHEEGRVAIVAQEDAAWVDDVDPLAPIGFDLVVPSRSPSGRIHKLGGRASWVQADDTPQCPVCRAPMAFLLQLASTHHFSFADEGMLYAFVCPPCRVTATLVQSH